MWSYKYIGCWMCKTEGSPTRAYRITKEFPKVEWLKKPSAEVIDLVSQGALFGPGAPDSNLDRFRIMA